MDQRKAVPYYTRPTRLSVDSPNSAELEPCLQKPSTSLSLSPSQSLPPPMAPATTIAGRAISGPPPCCASSYSTLSHSQSGRERQRPDNLRRLDTWPKKQGKTYKEPSRHGTQKCQKGAGKGQNLKKISIDSARRAL